MDALKTERDSLNAKVSELEEIVKEAKESIVEVAPVHQSSEEVSYYVFIKYV